MPVSPRDVEPFVNSSDEVDFAIRFIDENLASYREKFYRHGEYDDSYYEIMVPYQLDDRQMKELRDVYVNVGWPVVQAYQALSDPGKAVIRLFFKGNSKYIGAR